MNDRAAYGSPVNFSRPVARRVLASKVRISMLSPIWMVTAIRSPAAVVLIMRAFFGKLAVTSIMPALPSALKTR